MGERIIRHHFVPRFYLSAWHAADNKGTWLYYFSHGKLREKRRSASSIAHKDDLYTVWPDAHFSQRLPSDEVEREFFGSIDNEAARVHTKLLGCSSPLLNDEERLAWALFVNSLLYRGAAVIEKQRRESLEEVLDGRIQIPERFKAQFPIEAIVSNAVLTACIARVREAEDVKTIASWRWRVVTVPESTHLPTSDNPIVLNGGIQSEVVHCMSLAVSPRQLLVMHPESEDFDRDFMQHMIFVHCKAVVEGASAYVVGSQRLDDAGQIKYKRLLSRFLRQNDLSRNV